MIVKFHRRRKRRFKPFDPSAVEPPMPISLEHALEEGLMIAEYATRLALRNAITIGALRDSEPFHSARFVIEAREVIRSLAEESSDAAARVAHEREWATYLEGPAEHVHDYRQADELNLRRREALSRSLAETLVERADDEAYLLELVESARRDAWFDVARSIEEVLAAREIARDEDPTDRLLRIQEFVEIDLRALIDSAGPGAK